MKKINIKTIKTVKTMKKKTFILILAAMMMVAGMVSSCHGRVMNVTTVECLR